MPFTFAHPALVLPLLRQRRRWPWLSATGLVAGSLAPDFEKFFRLKLASSYSHTLASLFYFSLPVGLVLAFVYHALVRQPLLRNLPAPLHCRLAQWQVVSWPAFARQHPLGVLGSIWLGAALHLGWDSFTHHNALLLRYLPWLEQVVTLPGYHVFVYSFLALLSSVGGGLCIAWATWRLPCQPVGPPKPTAVWRYWGLVVLVAATLLGSWALAAHPGRASFTIAAVPAALLGIMLVSAIGRQPARQ